MRIVENAEALAIESANLFLEAATYALRFQSRFTVALHGGSTPKRTYELLASKEFRSKIPWERVHFFWGDERDVPPDHPASNFRLAWDSMLRALPVPSRNIHRVQTELGDAERGARDYEKKIRDFFYVKGPQETPRFDLVFLGLGEGGHTASLFPDGRADENGHLVIAPWVEHLNAFRISLTPQVFNEATHIVIQVSGRKKASILRDVLKGDKTYPALRIHPTEGDLLWLVDRDASSLLDENAA